MSNRNGTHDHEQRDAGDRPQGDRVNAALARRRELLRDSDAPTRVVRPQPSVMEAGRRDDESEVPDVPLEVEPGRRTRAHERPYAACIECPECDAMLEAQGSILQSVRCEGCGHLLTFEDVMALRGAEHTRTSRYM